jgi:hypothetical protein
MPWSVRSDRSGKFAEATLVRDEPAPPSNRAGDSRFYFETTKRCVDLPAPRKTSCTPRSCTADCSVHRDSRLEYLPLIASWSHCRSI